MTESQLEKANRLKKLQVLIENTESRIERVSLSWYDGNGGHSAFTKSILQDNDTLILIFDEVKEIANILLTQKIKKYKKQINKEFEKL